MRGPLGAAVVLLLLTAAPPLAAQADATADVVLERSLSSLVFQLRHNDEIPPGTFGLDPRRLEAREVDLPVYDRPVTAYRPGAERSESRNRRLLDRLSARTAALDDVAVCERAPDFVCAPDAFAAVLAAGEPTIDGDTAEVVLEVRWAGRKAGTPTPYRATYRAKLVRGDEGWTVRETRSLSIT